MAAFAQGDLQGLKGRYDDQVSQTRADCDAHAKTMGQQYTKGLQTLDAQFKRAGDLDSLLAVRKELKRFKENDALTAGDSVETPADLAAWQRNYLTAQKNSAKDCASRITKLTGAYVTQLEQLKHTLKQQGNLTALLDVQNELEQVRGDLPASTVTTAQPTRPPVVVPQTPVVPNPDNGTVLPPRSPQGLLVVTVTDNGVAANGVACLLQTEPAGAVASEKSDAAGKINFRAENAATYRLVLIADQYAPVEMSGLKAGESYSVKLQPRGPHEGVAEYLNRSCLLPEIGRLNYSGAWGADPGDHGIELFAENPQVQLQSDFVAYGNIAKTIAAFKVGNGRTATYALGDVRYEVKAIVVGDHIYLSYQRL